MDIPAKLLWRMASALTGEERAFVRWLGDGCTGPPMATPARLVARGYVREDLGGPALTATGWAVHGLPAAAVVHRQRKKPRSGAPGLSGGDEAAGRAV